jgi:hypothetical protein
MLHVTMLDLHPHTPTYLVVCAASWHRTVVDPLNPKSVLASLGTDKLDLIFLTAATEDTLAAAELLHQRTGAPILASESLRGTSLPVARYVSHGEQVGIGPIGTVVATAAGEIVCLAFAEEGLLLSGPLFATGVLGQPAQAPTLAALQRLPAEVQACGGGAYNVPLAGVLSAVGAA